jgi:hypothetical protein
MLSAFIVSVPGLGLTGAFCFDLRNPDAGFKRKHFPLFSSRRVQASVDIAFQLRPRKRGSVVTSSPMRRCAKVATSNIVKAPCPLLTSKKNP